MSKDSDRVTCGDEDAHKDPRSWPKPYQFFISVMISFYMLLSTMASSLPAPVLDANVNPSTSTATPS